MSGRVVGAMLASHNARFNKPAKWETDMKAILSSKKGEIIQQDMMIHGRSIPVGEVACRNAP